MCSQAFVANESRCVHSSRGCKYRPLWNGTQYPGIPWLLLSSTLNYRVTQFTGGKQPEGTSTFYLQPRGIFQMYICTLQLSISPQEFALENHIIHTGHYASIPRPVPAARQPVKASGSTFWCEDRSITSTQHSLCFLL